MFCYFLLLGLCYSITPATNDAQDFLALAHPFHQRQPGKPVSIALSKYATSSEKSSAILLKVKLRQQGKSLIETQDLPLKQEVLSEKHLATYYGSIKIGDQEFRLLLDTGSAELWVPSDECQTPRCTRHHTFVMSKSTLRLESRTPFDIDYLSGSVRGSLALVDVTLPELVVHDQPVGLASVVDIDLLDDVCWYGIVGLAYPSPQLVEQGSYPLFDTIIKQKLLPKQGLANQFAYYIDDQKGQMTFGGADCSLLGSDDNCHDAFHFAQVTKKSYWTIQLKDVRVKYPDKPEISGFCPPSGCEAIVDSGTYLMYGPEDQVKRMLENVDTCTDVSQLPEINLVMSQDGTDAGIFVLTLHPEDYVLEFDVQGKKDCVIGLSPDKDTVWTLGQVFLRSYYTLFDRDRDRVGFARLPRHTLAPIGAAVTSS